MAEFDPRALLADTLALWDVRATLSGGGRDPGDPLVVRTADGRRATLAPAGATERPVRWWVGEPDRPVPPRPCPSIVVALWALRRLLAPEGDGGRRLRVAAGRPEP